MATTEVRVDGNKFRKGLCDGNDFVRLENVPIARTVLSYNDRVAADFRYDGLEDLLRQVVSPPVVNENTPPAERPTDERDN